MPHTPSIAFRRFPALSGAFLQTVPQLNTLMMWGLMPSDTLGTTWLRHYPRAAVHRRLMPSDTLGTTWLRHYPRAAVHQRCQRVQKGLDTNHIPSIAFRLLPPNSATTSY